MEDNQDKETSTDEVQSHENINKTQTKPARGMQVCLLQVLCCLCDGLITRPEESYGIWCVTVCDTETSGMRRPWPVLGCCAVGKKKD